MSSNFYVNHRIIILMKNSFPKNLKELRLTNNMTQTQVAEKLKTTQRKVSYWESGKIEPDLDTLISIAELFDVSIDELVGRPV